MLYNVYPLDRILAVKTTNIKPLKIPPLSYGAFAVTVCFLGGGGVWFFSVL